MKKRALLSVYYKDGIVEFVEALISLGWEIVSSGGTARHLRDRGISVIDVSDITGYPPMLDHRVATLHPKIHGGILAKRSQKHEEELAQYQIERFNLVCVDLYPVFEAIARGDATIESVMELTDIGGPTLIRGAAKNHNNGVTVICDPADRQLVLDELRKDGDICDATRVMLAQKVFSLMSRYDGAISAFLAKQQGQDVIDIHQTDGVPLRYGENPHQKAKIFFDPNPKDPLAIGKLEQLHGKEMSYNNFLDAHVALEAACWLGQGQPFCGVIKHQNLCGASIHDDFAVACQQSWDGNPTSAYGGIVIANRRMELPVLEKLLWEPDSTTRFVELLIVPSVSEDVLSVIKKKRPNLRLLVNPALEHPVFAQTEIKMLRGASIQQEVNSRIITEADCKIMTKVQPTGQQLQDALFAIKACAVNKSNTIIFVKNNMMVGYGSGTTNRMYACIYGAMIAGERARGAVVASDSFFPKVKDDAPQRLIDAGVSAIILNGGGKSDQELIELCDENKVAVIFTGFRCFRH